MIIAIDGPAGAGKSTIASRVAEQLGFQLIDTGALYRIVALRATERGVDPADGAACAAVARSLQLAFEHVGGKNTLMCDGQAVGEEIRSEAVSQLASKISAHPAVRAALLDVQRRMGAARSSVLEGRDIGTVVCPAAQVKVFMTATDEERARRRTAQLAAKGQPADYDAILRDIRERDARDAGREVAPLVQAADAHVIDTTGLDIDDIVARIVALARAAGA
jgi:cytidylate kinase